MSFRENIRHALIWLEETKFDGKHKKFGDDLGVNRQKVRNWMIGECCPDLEMLGWIAKKYGLSLDWMIGGDSSKAPEGYLEYAYIHFGQEDEED